MDVAQRAYRDALVAHHRRTALSRLAAAGVILPLALSRRVRDGWAARDGWMLASTATTLGAVVVKNVVTYRRAERAAVEDLNREAGARAAVERAAARQRATGEPVGVWPAGARQMIGCVGGVGLVLAGSVQAVWDYTRRPDAGRRVHGPRWRPRPGPAWWTGWSWQELPVNAASTAPRARQIAYERRQLVTTRSTTLAARVVAAGTGTMRTALADREWPLVAASALDIAASALTAVAEYRAVPRSVDRRRARRRRHQAAVAALVADGGAPNPWRGEMLLAAVTVTAAVAVVTDQVRLVRRRPRRSSFA